MVEYDGHFIGKGGIIGAAIGNGRCDHMARSILMLEPFAAERCSSGRRADEEAARPLVARGPDQVADPLEPKHRIENIKGKHCDVMETVGGGGGNPGRDRTSLSDALFQQLSVARFAIIEHRARVFGFVQLTMR
jgi:hypothetical protein